MRRRDCITLFSFFCFTSSRGEKLACFIRMLLDACPARTGELRNDFNDFLTSPWLPSKYNNEKKDMTAEYQKKDHREGPGEKKIITEQHAAADSDGICRCKEISKMTPQELLKLMFSDLAFWKKAKKG